MRQANFQTIGQREPRMYKNGHKYFSEVGVQALTAFRERRAPARLHLQSMTSLTKTPRHKETIRSQTMSFHKICVHLCLSVVLFFQFSHITEAKLPELDTIYYGHLKDGTGEAVNSEAGNIIFVRAYLGEVMLKEVEVPEGTNAYMIKIPMDDGQAPRINKTARFGERIKLHIKIKDTQNEDPATENGTQGLSIPSEKGAIVQQDLTVPSTILSELDSRAVVSNDFLKRYYTGVIGLEGDALKAALHELMKGHTVIPHSSSTLDTRDVLPELYEDPDNSANLLLTYSGESLRKTATAVWAREHLWPIANGAGEGPALSDLFNLRPADREVIAEREGKRFDDVGSGTSPRYAPDTVYNPVSWEPRDSEKGDVARAAFYMAVRYEGEDGVADLSLSNEPNAQDAQFGVLSTLLRWHLEDPVDEQEVRINNLIYSEYQGNRNPFVDNPDWAASIWGEPPTDSTYSPNGWVHLETFPWIYNAGGWHYSGVTGSDVLLYTRSDQTWSFLETPAASTVTLSDYLLGDVVQKTRSGNGFKLSGWTYWDTWPWVYNSGHWNYVVATGGGLFVYNYTTEEWNLLE